MKKISSIMFPHFISLPAKKMQFFALLLSFCVLINSFYPRAAIELKNYDVVVLAMGSQKIFLHLFSFTNKVAVELANLLLNDKTQPFQAGRRGSDKTKPSANSSSDFSIRCSERTQNLKEFQKDILNTVFFISQTGINSLDGSLRIMRSVIVYGLVYFLFMLLFFSRPRGDVIDSLINITMIINNTEPGLNLKPGFLFSEVTL